MRNYIGTTIEKFEILNQKRENNTTYLYCKCKKCGNEKWIALRHVKNTKCCDSKSSSTCFKPLIPNKKIINNIELIETTDDRKGTSVVWKCKCFCGNIFYTTLSDIKRGKIKSCGCTKIKYTPENLEKANKTFRENFLVENTSLLAISNKMLSTNTSGVKGVYWNKSKQKWTASLIFQKKCYRKYFSTKEEATKCRKEWEEKYFKPILDKYKAE